LCGAELVVLLQWILTGAVQGDRQFSPPAVRPPTSHIVSPMKLLRPSVLALFLVPAGAAAQAPDSAARVDSVFARFAGTAGPGCAVGVARAGQPVLSRGYGMADLEHDVPITPGTVFEAGSVTKQFTAAAVLLLAQDGRLSLDDDVRKHIPELPAYAAPITLRHLLNHTSGLRDWGSVAAIGGWPRGTRTYTQAMMLDIASRQRALNYPTGQYYSYTNTGYNLLAIVVERAGGMTLPEFTRTRIFVPLGMTGTSWRDDYARVVKGRAVAYRPVGAGAFRMDMPFENAFGNGGLLTTTADLLRWNENLRTGQVGGPAFLREMHRQARLNGGRELEYASGLVVTRYRGISEVSHSGATAGYRAFLARYPEQRLDVALLCNAGSANPGALAHQVADVFLNAAPEAPGRPAAVDSALLRSRAGLYRDTRTSMVMRLAASGDVLTAVGRGPLVPTSPSRFRAGESWVVFDDAAGAGGHAGFRVMSPDGDTLRYEPVAGFAPGAAQLTEFAGVYHSDEADADLTFRVADGKLVMRDAAGNSGPVDPVYADTFGDGGGLIRFTRGPGGRVTGLIVVSDRVWSMPFVRR
jgi:CubicO group peptidase (beta-lactamase class C family)